MLDRIVTGGQTGADQAAWRAARDAGIATGGWMPRGSLTEEGPRPDLAALFGAREHESEEPEGRTLANVRDSDGTLVFVGDRPGPGTLLTIAACRAAGAPLLIVPLAHASGACSPAL